MSKEIKNEQAAPEQILLTPLYDPEEVSGLALEDALGMTKPISIPDDNLELLTERISRQSLFAVRQPLRKGSHDDESDKTIEDRKRSAKKLRVKYSSKHPNFLPERLPLAFEETIDEDPEKLTPCPAEDLNAWEEDEIAAASDPTHVQVLELLIEQGTDSRFAGLVCEPPEGLQAKLQGRAIHFVEPPTSEE